jgi:hypothetical protein
MVAFTHAGFRKRLYMFQESRYLCEITVEVQVLPVRVFSSLELQYLDVMARRAALELLAYEGEPDNAVERALSHAVLLGGMTKSIMSEQAFRELVEMFWEYPCAAPEGELLASDHGFAGTRWIV